jgi:hypothetical protein
MGNFSQDPTVRAADAIAKQYVGVRIQQAVPLLDADWNLLDDIRRSELEAFGRLFIGSGVPAGSDGFNITAVAQPNDFAIGAGLCLVGGKTARNDADVRYTTQPNFGNPTLVPPLAALTPPATNKPFLVVLDVWDREVDSDEDPALIDGRIGVETAVRLKREWAVRVFREPEDLPLVAAPPAGHAFLRLARINRQAGNATITAAMIVDLRDTQVTVLRKIEVRDGAGNIIVDNPRFQLMLEATRNNIQAFVRYITTQFNAIFVALAGGEVLGLEAAMHVAHTVEAGLAQIHAQTMANRGAVNFLRQLYQAEQTFMTVWRDVVLQLGTAPKKYASYQSFVNSLNARLNDAAVGPLTGLLPALNAGNLLAAVDMQEEIARLIGTAAATIARGSIQVSYVNAPPGNLTTGQIARFEFRVRSFTTQADSYTVTVLPPAGWPRVVVDSAGNPVPGNKVPIGPAGSETTIFVNVTVQTGSSDLQLRVVSDSNPAEIDQVTGLLTLTQGQPAPLGEDKIQFQLENPFRLTINPATGVATVSRPPAPQPASIGVRIFNNTGQTATFNVTVDVVPGTAVGTWTIALLGPAITPAIAHGASLRPGGINITAGADAVSVQARYIVSTTIAGATVTSQIIVPIVATA